MGNDKINSNTEKIDDHAIDISQLHPNGVLSNSLRYNAARYRYLKFVNENY